MLGVLAPLTLGEIIYVDDDAPPGGDGASWTTAFRFLQDALYHESAGDEIRIAGGTQLPDSDAAHPNGTGDLYATFALVSDVPLRGGYAGLADPSNPNRRDYLLFTSLLSGDLQGNDPNGYYDNCLLIVSGESLVGGLLEGVSVRGALRTAVKVSASELTMMDCAVEWNMPLWDTGALHAVSSELTLVRCQIRDNDARGVFCEGGSLTATDCAIDNNYAWDSPGGGVRAHGADALLTGCSFRNNDGKIFGGALCAGGSTLVVGCTFQGNVCHWGGGADAPTGECKGGAIYGYDVTVTHCTFTGNLARHGGALFGVTTIVNCTFENNTAESVGGAVCHGYIPPNSGRAAASSCRFAATHAGDSRGGVGLGCDRYGVIDRCVFLSNSALRGSAAYTGGFWYTNCVFSGNVATTGTVSTGASVFRNCSFAGNSATAGRALLGDSYTQLTNCVLWDGGAEISYEYGSPVVTYSDVYGGWAGTGNINVDPRFRNAAAGDLRLTFGSPCIDAGNNGAAAGSIDLAGNPRRVDDPNTPDTGAGTPPIVDMGAYERMPLGDLTCDGVVDDDDIDAFVLALSNAAAYTVAFPTCDWLYADCNDDWVVDFDDIDPFIARLSGE